MKKAIFIFFAVVLAIPNISLATNPPADCDTSSYIAPVVTATQNTNNITLSWDEIVHDNLTGYKVVISKNDSTPVYPANGYLSWITDTSITSKVVDNSSPYYSGDFGSYLEEGEDYYFSVTGVYDCGDTRTSVAGNVLHLDYLGNNDDSTILPSYPVCDHNNDGLYNLSDVSLFAACAQTFDADNDGDHDLTDISLYASNYADTSWCQTNVSECSPVAEIDYDDNNTNQKTCDHNGDGLYNLSDVSLFAMCIDDFDADNDGDHDLTDISLYASNHNNQAWCVSNLTECNDIADDDEYDHADYLDVEESGILSLTDNSAKVWWWSNSGADGSYRYATSESALENMSWKTSGVQNNPDVTGRYGKNYVLLNNLSSGTKYYIELRKTIESSNPPLEGETKTINFTTYSAATDLPVPEVTAVLDRGDMGTLIEWDPIDNPMFSGYKIVASKNNANPAYPADGYYKYITRPETRGLIINNENAYHNGDFGNYFVPGEEYYFSITALYNAGTVKVPGNVIQFAYVGPGEPSTSNKEESDDPLVAMRRKAELLYNEDLGAILDELNQLRNRVQEQENELKYLRSLVSDLSTLAQQVKDSINQFITYGVDENTKQLGAGERAAVIHSYKAAFGKLPETEDEMTDAIKIANGRWPSMTNTAAETRAQAAFRKIYLRDPKMSNPNDNAAVTVMAYGLRQQAKNRNLDSERNGINTFKYIYGHTPSTTEEWNIMQAITYSGATR